MRHHEAVDPDQMLKAMFGKESLFVALPGAMAIAGVLLGPGFGIDESLGERDRVMRRE